MSFDAHLRAHIQHRAGGAFGHCPGTDMFTKWNKKTVDIYPMFAGEFGIKCNHCLFGRGCLHIAPAIRYAVDMNINTNYMMSSRNA